MSTEITLTLPEPVYRSAERLAEGAQRSVQHVLIELLTETDVVCLPAGRPHHLEYHAYEF